MPDNTGVPPERPKDESTVIQWCCDKCFKPCNRMIYVGLSVYCRHLECEPKGEGAPVFQLKGEGWSKDGYSKTDPKS